MVSEPLPIVAVGAGQVFQRLYVPALARVPGLRLAAVADPSAIARARLPRGVVASDSIDGLVDVPCAGALVLSPADLHAAHAALLLDRGVAVMLEKPSATASVELAAWPSEWRASITPARPRRYWPAYLGLRRSLPHGASLELTLHTSPASWGATTSDPVADDLLPHLTDLAAWLTREHVAAAEGEVHDEGGNGTFILAGGRTVQWGIAHGDSYVEQVSAGPLLVDLTRQSIGERVGRRLGLRPPTAVLGVARMLRLWERRLRGESPPGLPGDADVETELRVREALRTN